MINSIDLSDVAFENDALFVINKNIAIKYSVLPFKIEKSKIHVAMVNTSDISAKDYLRFLSKKEIIAYNASNNQLKHYIELCYGSKTIKDTMSNYSNKNNRKSEAAAFDVKDDSPAITIVSSILNKAILKGASDIHIEPFKNKVNIRIRIDGILQKEDYIDFNFYEGICTRIKIMACMDITERRIPQDGSICYEYENKIFNMRVSAIPVIHGEKIVIRILYDSVKLIDIDNLSESPDSLNQIKKILNYESGLVLATGPTGSGKTTTLYAILNKLNNNEKNIITIENPVEYEMYGINQININPNYGMTFEKCLKNILRQDPDIISLGEIRDEVTANVAMQASISGHLVFSTLHTRNCSEAVLRLLNMKVPWYLLHDSICTILSQRLVKKICPYCKKEYKLSLFEREFLKDNNCYIDTAYKGYGCNKCNGTGYIGRTAIYETIHFNTDNRNLINKDYISENISSYMKEKQINNLFEVCLNLVINGKTSINELFKINSSI